MEALEHRGGRSVQSESDTMQSENLIEANWATEIAPGSDLLFFETAYCAVDWYQHTVRRLGERQDLWIVNK